MSQELKNYIYAKLINKEGFQVEEDKYKIILVALAKEFLEEHLRLENENLLSDEICSYIMRSAIDACMQIGVVPTDKNILNIISLDFCINRAYEYLQFKQNDHEYYDDYELNQLR